MVKRTLREVVRTYERMLELIDRELDDLIKASPCGGRRRTCCARSRASAR